MRENASTNTQQAGEESDSESNQGTSPPLACLNMGFWIQVRFFLQVFQIRRGGQQHEQHAYEEEMGSVSRWVRDAPKGAPMAPHAANENTACDGDSFDVFGGLPSGWPAR